MPYGYLATLLIWGLATAAMLHPPRRPIWLARGVYFFSVLLNELPLLGLLLLTLATAQALLVDDLLSTPVGALALAAAVLVAAGMIALQVAVTRARPAIAMAVGVPAGSRPFRWAWLLPFLRPTDDVERLANIPYAPGGRQHLMDLYRRRDLCEPVPVLIYLHGGRFSGGDKHFESGPLKQRMAQRGWIVLSANYALRPQAQWPEHLVDVKRVIAWVHAHAEEFGMDDTTLVVAGSSAGAHLAVHAALSANQADLQPGFEDVDTRVSAAIGLYGYYGGYYGRRADEHPSSDPLDRRPPTPLQSSCSMATGTPTYRSSRLVTSRPISAPGRAAQSPTPSCRARSTASTCSRLRATEQFSRGSSTSSTSTWCTPRTPGRRQHIPITRVHADARPGTWAVRAETTNGQTPPTGLP